MLNLSEMPSKDRCDATTLFIKNVGRKVQATLRASEGLAGEKIDAEFEGYQDDHLIVRVKHRSARGSTKRILWPFVMLEGIHFPEGVT